MTYKTTKEEQEWEAEVIAWHWASQMTTLRRREYFVDRCTKDELKRADSALRKALAAKRRARKKMLDKFLKQHTNKGV